MNPTLQMMPCRLRTVNGYQVSSSGQTNPEEAGLWDEGIGAHRIWDKALGAGSLNMASRN